jgi:hypothetical protein
VKVHECASPDDRRPTIPALQADAFTFECGVLTGRWRRTGDWTARGVQQTTGAQRREEIREDRKGEDEQAGGTKPPRSTRHLQTGER